MALPQNYREIVDTVTEQISDGEDGPAAVYEGIPSRREQINLKRSQVLSLRLAGLSYQQIAERMLIDERYARTLVRTTLERAENESIQDLRNLENERLDAAQRNIWGQVMKGDHKAIQVFLSIHDRRARVNGLNAPTRVDMSITMRKEVEDALEGLERLILEGETVENELPPLPPLPELPPELSETELPMSIEGETYDDDAGDWLEPYRGPTEEAVDGAAQPCAEGEQ